MCIRDRVERIKGLRITSTTQVRDFVAESDRIDTFCRDRLVGAEEVRVFYHADEPIVEVTLRVPAEQVIRIIRELHARHIKGDDIRGTDIRNVERRLIRRSFEATGMGIPPQRYIRRYEQLTGSKVPDWASQVIRATGRATDPQINTPRGRLRAARAAEIDAKRKLAERIKGLQITATTTVEQFVAEHDRIVLQIDAIIAGAYVEKTEFTPDGMAVVTVALPGARLWSVISDEMRIRSK